MNFYLVFFFKYSFIWLVGKWDICTLEAPHSLWAGVCDHDQISSLAGRVAQSCGSYAQFFVFYVTLSKNRLACTYIIIKLYNNKTYNIIYHIIYILLYYICILFILYIFIFNCSCNMAKLCTIILLWRFFNNDAWTPHCARNLAVRRARQCSSFFEANVGSSDVQYF